MHQHFIGAEGATKSPPLVPPRLVPTAAAPLSMVLAAGFINGAASRTLTAPFDRLRAVMATGRESSVTAAVQNIVRTQGYRGFWSANVCNVLQCGPENAIAFTAYEMLRGGAGLSLCTDAGAPTMAEKFFLGSISGALAMSIVYPMYVVQNRMAAAVAGEYTGMLHCMQQTARGGRSSMYAGFTVSLIRVLPLKGIMLGGYFTLKDLMKDPQTGEISTLNSLACSAVAGGVAHSITYPLHLARTVLMQHDGARYTGFVQVLTKRIKARGIAGVFAGLPMWLCNRIPAVAIEFAVNERALDALRAVWPQDSIS
jgi:solute carrier family 25 (mitochondrial phosphate transporter), member 23/24/25/41